MAQGSHALATRLSPGGNDSVRDYLAAIGEVPLLSADEEVALAERIRAGVEASQLLNTAEAEGVTLPTYASRIARRAVADGEAARDHMTRANLRLVVSIAKRYKDSRVPFIDLIQEGNLGLMRAIDRFDHTRGFRFSTYGTWWIKQAITAALGQHGRTIRIPQHLNEMIRRVVRERWRYMQEVGSDVTLEQLAAEVDLPVTRVRECLLLEPDTVSLDEPLSSVHDGLPLHETVVDRSTGSPDAQAAGAMLGAIVAVAVDCVLSEREREVIRLRFGLGGGTARTLEEIGVTLGVSRERVRQIEANALGALRGVGDFMQLDAFLDA